MGSVRRGTAGRLSQARSVAAAVLTGAIVIVSGVPARAQIPNPPPPPEQLQPAVNTVSPLVFQACLGQSSVAALAQAASAIAPVPVQINDVLSPVRNVILLDVACGFFSPKIVPATCDVDSTIPPTVINLPQPASMVATEVIAIELAGSAYGAPLDGQVSGPVFEQLGCRQ